MINCNTVPIPFSSCKRRLVQASFSGGDITSDGGSVVLREMDRQLNLTSSVARVLEDNRDKKKVQHDQLSLLRQRVYGICLGYEDLNDHSSLRKGPLIQTVLGKDSALASPSTLCRFENNMGRDEAVAIHKVLVEQFISSFYQPPDELILDFDATDDAAHCQQEGRFFMGITITIVSCHYMFFAVISFL